MSDSNEPWNVKYLLSEVIFTTSPLIPSCKETLLRNLALQSSKANFFSGKSILFCEYNNYQIIVYDGILSM
jgi:hypothetical protein